MSVGVVIVTHYRLGEEFLQALRLIVPEGPRFYAVSIDPKQSVEEMRTAIQRALGDGPVPSAGAADSDGQIAPVKVDVARNPFDEK